MVLALSSVVFLGFSAAAERQTAQAPPVTFRAASNYVEVIFRATDRDGRFISDLIESDISVFEDGKPQHIDAFSSVLLPARAGAGALAAAPPTPGLDEGPSTNAHPLTGRTYVVLIDTLHISASRIPATKALLRKFVQGYVGPDDQVAVVHVGRPGVSQDFTSNHAKLLASIDQLMGERLRSRALTKWDQIVLHLDSKDIHAPERAANARQSIDSLRRLAELMSGLHGRQTAVLLVSEGTDMDLNDRVGLSQNKRMVAVLESSDTTKFNNNVFEAGYAGLVADELQQALETTSRASVAVYTVDPRGVANGSEDLIGVVGRQDEGVNPQELPTRAVRREFLDSQHYLRGIAEHTGGRAIVGTNNYDDGFAAIVRDLSGYYVLGYRTSAKADGRFHRIAVTVRRPQADVHARKGYVASKRSDVRTGSDGLDAALASPMAVSGLSLRATSTVLPRAVGRGSLVQFAVELAGADLGLVQRDGKFAGTIQIRYGSVDSDGRLMGAVTKSAALSLPAAAYQNLSARGFRYVGELELPPGRHQIRLAARAPNDSHGSVFWDVDVPDCEKDALYLSPPALVSDDNNAVPTVSDATQSSSAVSLMTAGREFRSGESLRVATAACGRATRTPVTVQLTISTDGGAEVFRISDVRPLTGSSIFPRYLAEVPAGTLAPGRYVLTVQASPGSSLPPVLKRIGFSVR